MVHFLLQSENPHIFAPVRAIVDTGSPITILGLPDLKKMRVSQLKLKDLESRKETISYGGGQVRAKILRDNKIKIGEFECSVPIQIPVEEIKDCSQPTILGVDFLIENKLSLFFDPTKKEAYFEQS